MTFVGTALNCPGAVSRFPVPGAGTDGNPCSGMRPMRTTVYFFAMLGGLALPAAPLLADRIAPPPLWQRLAKAETVLVGRVLALEDEDATVAGGPGQPQITYRVAIVAVNEPLWGLAKDKKTVRVAFV